MTRDPMKQPFTGVRVVGPVAYMRGWRIGWIRIFGWGFHWNRREHMLFSERNGYRKFIRIGPWRVRLLRPGKGTMR